MAQFEPGVECPITLITFSLSDSQVYHKSQESSNVISFAIYDLLSQEDRFSIRFYSNLYKNNMVGNHPVANKNILERLKIC